jgi:hypothetical protein
MSINIEILRFHSTEQCPCDFVGIWYFVGDFDFGGYAWHG